MNFTLFSPHHPGYKQTRLMEAEVGVVCLLQHIFTQLYMFYFSPHIGLGLVILKLPTRCHCFCPSQEVANSEVPPKATVFQS